MTNIKQAQRSCRGAAGRRPYCRGGTTSLGQQLRHALGGIDDRKTALKGGGWPRASKGHQHYTANKLNQYTQRTVPGYVDVLGRAHSNATVTVWAEGEAGPVRAGRHGDYYRAEVNLDNSGGPVYAALTNLAVLPDGANPDITTNAVKHALLPPAVETYTHDDDGNLTADGLWTYTWNGENRLIAMESVAGVPDAAKYKLTFQYDAEGRRVSKVVYTWTGVAWFLTKWHRYAYDGWNLVADMEVRNGVTNTYTWGLDLSGTPQGAGGVGGLLLTTDYGPLTTSHFVAYDGNGNVMALVDASDGQESARYEYGPFGEPLRATGPLAATNPFRFSTKYEDTEAGLYYYGYRYYDPVTGRWLSADPAQEIGSANLYSFTGNQATSIIDALGLLPATLPQVIPFRLPPVHIKIPAEFKLPQQPWESPWIDDLFPVENCKAACDASPDIITYSGEVEISAEWMDLGGKAIGRISLQVKVEHCRKVWLRIRFRVRLMSLPMVSPVLFPDAQAQTRSGAADCPPDAGCEPSESSEVHK